MSDVKSDFALARDAAIAADVLKKTEDFPTGEGILRECAERILLLSAKANEALAREAKLREALEQVREQWALAMYGATENGVASLNEQAARSLPEDFVEFGKWLTALSDQHPADDKGDSDQDKGKI